MGDDDQRFPRAPLNAAALPWARAVQKRIVALESAKASLDQGLKAQGRFVSSMKGGGYADGSIYRPNGIVAVGGDIDFTVFRGVEEDDDSQYASLNLQPGFAALRAQNNANGLADDLRDGLVRLSPTSFQVGHGLVPDHLFGADGNTDNQIGLQSTAFYFEWHRHTDDQAMNRRALVLGDGMFTAEDVDTAGLFSFEIPNWIKGEVTTDLDGAQHRKLIFFGSQSLGDDGTGTIGGGGGSVPDATHTLAGKVRLATDAEVATGTDDTTAVTPHQVAVALSGVGGGGTRLADLWRGEWVQP